MKRYLMVMGGMLAFFLCLFFLVEALGIPLLVDPTPWLNHAGVLAATLGVALLIADVLLPVPSSLVMVAHGALFGVLIGTLLSLLGSTGATLFGFWIGRRGGKLLQRLVTPEERERTDRLLERWGTLAIIVTRPIPLMAETVAIMAGASPVTWGRTALAAVAGSLPPALLYALTGATAGRFQNTALMFLFVLLITGIFWMVGRKIASDKGFGLRAAVVAGKTTEWRPPNTHLCAAPSSLDHKMDKQDPAQQEWLESFIARHEGVAGTVHVQRGEDLYLTAAHNIPPPVVAIVSHVPRGKGMAGLAQVKKSPVQTCNLQTDETGNIKPGAKAVNAQAAIALPVLDDKGDVRAVVGMAWNKEREIAPEEERALVKQASALPQ